MSDRELMQQALEDLRIVAPDTCVETIEALRARLAEPDDKPLAFVHWPVSGYPRLVWYSNKALENAIRQGHDGNPPDLKLYTRPAARKVQPLTTLEAFDAALSKELPRVSHVEYDSHEICKHFASELRKRIAGITGDSHE